MAFNLTDFDKIWASTSPLTPYSFSDANYKRGWDFVGSTPPSRQMWDAFMQNADEKSQWLYNNKLSLSGGTMTGDIDFYDGLFLGSPINAIDPSQKSTFIGLYENKNDPHKYGSVVFHQRDNNPNYRTQITFNSGDGTNRNWLAIYGDAEGGIKYNGASFTDGTFLTVRNVSVNVTTTGGGVKVGTATAPAVSGYQFVCWYFCVSIGGVYPAYPSSPQSNTSDIWAVNPTSGSSVACHALYVRKW